MSAVHSLAGFHLADRLITRPPYSDPHHSATVASMVGGGPRLAKPGAISCAHKGVFFLDEAPEFAPAVIDALRTPLESGTVQLGRSEAAARYPARFQLILAANPCPCGPGRHAWRRGVSARRWMVRRYAEKICGPIRDRIDINQAFLPMRKAYLKAALQRDGVLGGRRRAGAPRRGIGSCDGWQAPGWRDQRRGARAATLRRHLPLPDGLSGGRRSRTTAAG